VEINTEKRGNDRSKRIPDSFFEKFLDYKVRALHKNIPIEIHSIICGYIISNEAIAVRFKCNSMNKLPHRMKLLCTLL
jgi:hypothetical protein